jgi:hypothetical protein
MLLALRLGESIYKQALIADPVCVTCTCRQTLHEATTLSKGYPGAGFSMTVLKRVPSIAHQEEVHIRPSSSKGMSAWALIVPLLLQLVGAQSGSRSLIDRLFHPAVPVETPFSLLPRLFDQEFASAVDTLNRAVNGLIRFETGKDKSLVVTIDDMGLHDDVNLEFDARLSLLTVKASSTNSDGSTAWAERVVTIPTKVIKPELITAETKNGRVVVTIPPEAQAAVEKKQLKNEKLDVKIIGAPPQAAPMAIEAEEKKGSAKKAKDEP